jgi:hypothetical protein
MHILYLDESGSPNSWNIQKNFVLGGVAIHEGQIYALNRALNAIQEKYFPGITVPIEFHVSPIRKGTPPHFNQFSEDVREQIINDVYDVIQKASFPGFIAFATSIDISAVKDPTQVSEACFEDVCQHFNLFLHHQYKKGIPTKGLLIIDRGREKQYLQHFTEFKKATEVEKFLGNIIDIPYFAACSETRMLQIADFISNAVFRYYESGITKEMDKVLPRFYTGPKYQPISGLGHITNQKGCQCHACQHHSVSTLGPQ